MLTVLYSTIPFVCAENKINRLFNFYATFKGHGHDFGQKKYTSDFNIYNTSVKNF